MPNLRALSDARRSLHLALLLLTIVFATWYKIAAFERSSRYDPIDETCQYWTESAFHYRYAKMVAEGHLIPAFDRDAQHPEGVRPYDELTIGMEYPPGLLYHLVKIVAPGLPFHRWLVWFVCAFSSLSIVAAFVAARAIWASETAGLVAAVAYALSPFSFNRLIANYGREDFALPLLFLSFAFLVAALYGGEQRRRDTIAAAVFLVAGLAVWHVSRFHLLFIVLALAPVTLLFAEDRVALVKTLRLFALILLAAGLMLPPLRAKGFLFSPSFVAIAALLATAEVARARSLRGIHALALFAVIFIPASFIAASLSPGEKEYSHVTGLAVEKIKHLGTKPANPADLPYDARTLWVEAFESPQAAAILVPLSSLALWAPAALALGVLRALRGRLAPLQILALGLAIAYLLMYLLLERFSPFFIFFLALALPVVLTLDTRWRGAVVALLVVSAAYEVWYDLHFDKPNPWRNAVLATFPPKAPEIVPNYGNNERVVRWIRRYTPTRAVILTWYPTGPMVITYTGRPINLHSKFESSLLRDKERRMIEALYGDEEGFYALCKDFETDYFLYQANLLLDASTSSSRYMADRMRVPTTSAAYLFHFQPDSLEHFTLVYQDSFYRLYKVRRGDEVVVPPHPIPYEEMFDASLIAPASATYDDRQTKMLIGRFMQRLMTAKQAMDLYARHGKRPAQRAEAERLSREALRLSPDCADALAQLALIASDEQHPEEAGFLLSRALTTHPTAPELHTVRAVLLERVGRREDARAALDDALELAPGFAPARARLAALASR